MENWKILAVTHFAVGLAGFTVAPRELLDTDVKSAGLFTTDSRRVLAATVLSLRAENKLLVYTYKGSAAVSVERTKLWILTGHQDLIVPAEVGFYIDLSLLDVGDVAFDPKAQLLTVQLPQLVLGEIAFQPEAARTFNGGLLTFDQDQVDELARAGWLLARQTFTKNAQGATLRAAAKEAGARAVASIISVPLRALGRPDVRVHVRFAS